MPKKSHINNQVDLQQAADLLSQQIWCWGRDIIRPQGNWLLQIGFDRIKPSTGQEECPSAYKLDLPNGCCVVLRGFGLFYGDRDRGNVFLPRYEFQPRYTTQAAMICPPSSDADVPHLDPTTAFKKTCFASLILDAIDWIQTYEANIIEQLGIEYRRSTLIKWHNGKRAIIPAEEVVHAWQLLETVLADDFKVFDDQNHLVVLSTDSA